jgi:MFS family permease
MRPAAREVVRLACCQGLLMTNHVTLIAVNGLAGLTLAEPKFLATLPQAAYLLGAALATIPASLGMQRYGRRAGFTVGTVCAMVGAAMAASALWVESFILLCLGSLVTGVYNAFGQYLRFAAADVAEAEPDDRARGFKNRAISLVLAGGIAGGILGPEASKLTKDLLAVTFAGSYAFLVASAGLSLLLVRGLHITPLPPAGRLAQRRPLAVIIRQPAFVVAVRAATTAYGAMNLLMVATPLTMRAHEYSYATTAFVIEWHMIGMFAPGLVTGALINRIGAPSVIVVGSLVMAIGVLLARGGSDLLGIWMALVLLGVGWNLMYTAGTTLLTTTYAPSEKAAVQGINDLLVFMTTIASSFSAGALVVLATWDSLVWLVLPLVTVATAATAMLIVATNRQRMRQPAP